MTIYLIKKDDELHIYKVLPEQEVNFLAKYGQQILMWGETIQEVLRKFNAMPRASSKLRSSFRLARNLCCTRLSFEWGITLCFSSHSSLRIWINLHVSLNALYSKEKVFRTPHVPKLKK